MRYEKNKNKYYKDEKHITHCSTLSAGLPAERKKRREA